MSQALTIATHQLAELKDQLLSVVREVEGLVKDLHSYELNLRPDPGRWSIAECLVHLNLFSNALLPVIREACDEARASGVRAAGEFKMDSVGRVLKYSLEPPYRVRVSTSPQFEPLLVEPLDEVVPRFVALQHELISLLDQADGLDLNHIKIASPVSRHVRYNLYACFHVMAAHQRRHLWQAQQVKAEIKTRTT